MGITFRSVHHPGSAPPALVYARALLRPFAACMLPVMVVASVLVLDRFDPLLFLAWSTPFAYLVATAWTAYNLGRQPAEVSIDAGYATLRTVWQVARGLVPEAEGLVLDAQDRRSFVHLSLGNTVFELLPEEWLEFDAMWSALDQAVVLNRVRPARDEDPE